MGPVFLENYLNVCARARGLSQERAAKFMAAQKDPEKFEARDNSTLNPGAEEVTWPRQSGFEIDVEEGRCQCRKTVIRDFGKTLFCAREYEFSMTKRGQGIDGQFCRGFSVKKNQKVNLQRYGEIGSIKYCQEITKDWQNDCQKGKKQFSDSKFAKENRLQPGVCVSQAETLPAQRCICSPSVISANDFGEQDFACLRTSEAGPEILNMNTKTGD